jgi:surface polysaccharide O-acyltransferase-like enzyme
LACASADLSLPSHQTGEAGKILSPNAYTAYLIHGPVVTTLALAAQGNAFHPLLKWVLLSLVAIPVCFALSNLVRKLPYAERVL